MNKAILCLITGMTGLISAYLAVWYLIVKVFYSIDLNFTNLIRLGLVEAFAENHRLITVVSVFMALTSGLIIVSLLTVSISSSEKTISGSRLITQKELIRLALKRCSKKSKIFIGGVPFPDQLHMRHILLTGPTGTGKTNAYYGLVQGIQARDERMIILDPDGSYLSRFARKGDVLINPFDKRSIKWDPFNDVQSDLDADAMALALLPTQRERDEKWDANARPLLAHCISACQREGIGNMEGLLNILTSPADEIERFINTNHLPGYFDEGATRALGSVLFTIGSRLQMFRHIYSGSFSIKKWVSHGNGNLYLTWRVNELAVLSPFYTVVLEVILRALLSTKQKPTWLLIDEIGQLGQLASIRQASTYGRDKNLRLVAGVQSNAQFEGIYGHHDARAIIGNLSSTLILGASHHDREQAKAMAESFGQVEILRKQHTVPTSQRGSGSFTEVLKTEQVVRPEEIVSLPVGEGFLKLAGDLPASRVKVPSYSPEVRHPGFVPRVNGAA